MGNKRWTCFRSAYLETDLWVAIDSGHYRKEAQRFTMDRILCYREILEKHIRAHPEFRESLTPVVAPGGAHPLITGMSEAALAAGTGPMSAVAGALAELICMDLLREYEADEVVVEERGRYLHEADGTCGCGCSCRQPPPLSEKIALHIKPRRDTARTLLLSPGPWAIRSASGWLTPA